ncbi:MAG TPA: tetratricopeptide repeat protein [Candidatus Sulfotelmatobacter sp.]|jgi:tol-pal system protein YbgF|nr:tetratricopeptide repeat protein [Candidatus Sulfotelmatobacter sp.]
MKKQSFIVFVALLAFVVCASHGAAAADTKSQLIQIQTQLQIMQDNMARMQQTFDERMGVMKDLLTQQIDNVNKMGVTVQNLQKTVGQQTTDAGSKVDQISGQVQALHDAVDELKARLAKVSKQLDDIQTAQQNIAVPPVGAQPAGGAPATAAVPQAPPADQLYNDGLRDYNSNKNDLASQEFAQYLQVYGNTDLAGNAQFYLGEIAYRQGNFSGAVQAYNKVLDQYPGGNKTAAAQLKKAYALLELGQRDAGVQELRSLISRYPKSPEALQARDRLNKLGAAGAASKGKVPRPSPIHR